MKVALLGTLQSGKSTLLAALSGREPAPPGGQKLKEEVIAVPDERLSWLTGLYQPKATVPAQIQCLDLPALNFADEPSRGASRRLIDQVRTVDMYVLVVRAFADESVPAYRGAVDPLRDLSELLLEFILTDLSMALTRIERLQEQIKKGSKTKERDERELVLQVRLQEALEEERPLSSLEFTEQEQELIRSLNFLTLKPISVVINSDEEQTTDSFDFSGVLNPQVPLTVLSAKLEYELQQLDDESRVEMMEALGVAEPALNKFVQGCYAALGLISFLTVGSDEVRAWAIRRGTTAEIAAGTIHSDLQRGFIRAETMAYSVLRELGDEKAVKAAGKMRLEGRDYIVEDGDILNVRFNV